MKTDRMLQEYWPSMAETNKCIRTEAEELAEHVLIAVHEPMQIEKRRPNGGGVESATEVELLEQLLKVSRPIPIIGESGIGKSHLIRWLAAKLKVHPDASGWHIRRIPKNAGLRGVLEGLLDGLEGEEFEKIRQRVSNVGDELNVERVADILIVLMGHKLEDLAKEAAKELEALQARGDRPDQETINRINLLRRHAGKGKLPELLNDPHFNQSLKDPETGVIFKIAERLAGKTDAADVAHNDYQIREEDLNFQLTLNDLSSPARSYIQQATLNTSEDKRKEVKDLLNEIINTSVRDTFFHIFEFKSESFQNLFKDIRRYLHKRNKTLVILVEDMAAISAIEDVLIDSLLEEEIRDGQQDLCPLRSAIAVTEGYEGYKRRQATLATRAQFEWYISSRSADEEGTLVRIENFCGRYLNAARIGEKNLKDAYDPALNDSNWPSIWHSDDPDLDLLEQFGSSSEGVPLFPFNKRAIHALARRFCTKNDIISFNPRTILQLVLRRILDYRNQFDENRFPPEEFEKIRCPGQLAATLEIEVHEDLERAETFAAIWGYGANDLTELSSLVSPRMAEEFYLDSLAKVLSRVRDNKPVSVPPLRPVTPPKGEIRTPPAEPKPEVTLPEVVKIAQSVDRWFEDQVIPQQESNTIRKTLVSELETFGKTALRWWGVVDLPPLRSGTKYLIHLAYGANNPANAIINFGGSDGGDFKKEEKRYKAVITSILRKEKHGSWSYDEGYDDFCRYQNFLSTWLPSQIEALIARERKVRLQNDFIKHAELAMLYEPRLAKIKENKVRALEILVKSESALRAERIHTGLKQWDEYVSEVIDQWESAQMKWLPWFTPAIKGSDRGRRGIEGDLLFPRGMEFSIDKQRKLKGVIKDTKKELAENYKRIISFLKGCSTKQEFQEILSDLKKVIQGLKAEDQYKGMGEDWTSRKFINRIDKVDSQDVWKSVQMLLNLFESDESYSPINSLVLKDLNLIEEVLENWSLVYDRNYLRLQNENNESGATACVGKKLEVEKLLSEFAQEFKLESLEDIA